MIHTLSRRALLGSGLCLATAALGQVVQSPKGKRVEPIDLEGLIPAGFAGWEMVRDVRPILPDENEQKAIARAYDQSFSRVYRRANGDVVMLVIAHGDTDAGMLAIHRPATCYTASGFTVLPGEPQRLAAPFGAIVPDSMFAVRGERQEPILTWMTIAGRQSGFGVGQNIAVLRAAWRGEPAEGFLIRASTFGSNGEPSYTVLRAFLGDMLPALPETLRQRLGGSA